MAISNCSFSPTSENPCGFPTWCVLAKLSANPRNEIIHKHVIFFIYLNQRKSTIRHFNNEDLFE